MIQVFNCYLYPGKHPIDHFLDVSCCRASDCRAGGGGGGGGGRGSPRHLVTVGKVRKINLN